MSDLISKQAVLDRFQKICKMCGEDKKYNGVNAFNSVGMIQKFNEFRQNLTGDPRRIVQNLLNSGQMSQAQFNQLSQMANEFQKYLR